MKLIIATPSPYARKVRVSLQEKKIDHEVIIDVPWNKNTLTKDKNPLGKVPILITKEKQHIFDSKVIIRYLDQIVTNPKLYPSDHKNELSTLTIEAIADGICDAVVLIRLENVRVNNLISKQWIERQEEKIFNGLKYLSKDLGSKNYFVDDYFNIADISAFTSLEYLDIRFKELDWRRKSRLDDCKKTSATRKEFHFKLWLSWWQWIRHQRNCWNCKKIFRGRKWDDC